MNTLYPHLWPIWIDSERDDLIFHCSHSYCAYKGNFFALFKVSHARALLSKKMEIMRILLKSLHVINAFRSQLLTQSW